MSDPSWSTDDLRLTDPDAYPFDGSARKAPRDGRPREEAFDSPPPFEVSMPVPRAVPRDATDLAHPRRTPAVATHELGSTGASLAQPRRISRGHLSWTALLLVGSGTAVGALLLYQAIASVSLVSKDPLGNGLRWLTGWVATDVVITVGIILAVMGLVRGPRRGIAGVSLALGVLITPLIFFGAVQLGVDRVQDRARAQLAGAADAAGTSVVDYADQHDIDLGPFRSVLDALLDDGR